ncbi:MAG: invasion associated locus B family protein, partial [Beijerinckiaceae bacterium]
MNGTGIAGGLRLLALSAAVAGFASAASAQQPQRPAGQGQQRPAAQPAAPAAPPAEVIQLKGDPNQAEWTKVCGRDAASQRETCYTTRDFVAENNVPVLAVAIYETKLDGGRAERQIRYLLPLSFLLIPGVRTSIDGGQPIAGRYSICLQNGCFAEFAPNEAQFTAFKKAQKITLQVQNQAAREVSFAIPLDGFAKGFDGPPIDPRVIEEQQKKIQEELQKRSDEMRRQMEQGGA